MAVNLFVKEWQHEKEIMAMDCDPFRVYGVDDRGYYPLVYFGFRQRKQEELSGWIMAGNVYILRWKYRPDTAGEIYLRRWNEETGEIHLGGRFRKFRKKAPGGF